MQRLAVVVPGQITWFGGSAVGSTNGVFTFLKFGSVQLKRLANKFAKRRHPHERICHRDTTA